MFKTKAAAPRVLQGLCRVTMHASSAQHDQELTPGHTNKVNHSHWPKALMHKSVAHRYFASRSSHRLVEIYIYMALLRVLHIGILHSFFCRFLTLTPFQFSFPLGRSLFDFLRFYFFLALGAGSNQSKTSF